jgi:DNA-directed RNA polymerase subunit L
MNPEIVQVSEENNQYRFTMRGINVSLANALRRTIISDIRTTVIYTETEKDNQCAIAVNTSRLHNEILKHRLSCIPIHETDITVLPGNYVLEIDVKNDTDSLMFVTTEHFKIKNKTSGKYVTENEQRRIFPPNSRTNYYIDFARLRPKIGDTIPGEHIKLTADFTTRTAKDNGMYNVVSKCSYGNTLDAVKISEFWEQHEAKMRSDPAMTDKDIEFEKKNFYLLDAQRMFVPDCFDFVVETVGIHENKDLVRKACTVIIFKLIEFMNGLDSDTVPIHPGETTMDNCFDVVLENEDYTLGKMLEYILYEKHYVKDKTLSFCGFKKFHPHNQDSVIRLAFDKNGDKTQVQQYMKMAAQDASKVFSQIHKMFA